MSQDVLKRSPRKTLRTQTLYDREYFEDGVRTGKSLYENYRWLPELTIPMCAELIELLGIRKTETVLDFGCAKGYMVQALRLLGRRAWGYEPSNYARKKGIEEFGQDLFVSDAVRFYDWIIAKDTLEHLTEDEIDEQLVCFNSRNLFVVVPLSDDGVKYNAPEYELDGTHITRRSLEWWTLKLKEQYPKVGCATYRFGSLKRACKVKRGNGFIWVHQ